MIIADSSPLIALRLETRPLSEPIDDRIRRADLGAGESEVLSLALEIVDVTAILDERAARRLAVSLGIATTGTLGVLLEARRRNLIPSLRPHLQARLEVRFFLSPTLIEQILAEVGEE